MNRWFSLIKGWESIAQDHGKKIMERKKLALSTLTWEKVLIKELIRSEKATQELPSLMHRNIRRIKTMQ